MGNDGGSIPTRRELVKNAARNPNTSEVKATQLESQTHAWTYCPLSQKPLATPIVSDCAGILYNKDAVLEYLLPSDDPTPNAPKSEREEILAGRIKGLRDVVEVKFRTENDSGTKQERRVCPITSKELGPSTKAIYLVPCGHAFAEAAVREIAGEVCLECNETFTPDNVISILPLAEEEVDRLTTRMERLKERGLTHSLKKAPGSKKRKKHQDSVEATDAKGKVNSISVNASEIAGKEERVKAEDSTSVPKNGSVLPLKNGAGISYAGIKNAATASLTAKVLDEQEEKNKRRKLGLNENLKSLFSKTETSNARQGGGDFMTRGYSIPKRA